MTPLRTKPVTVVVVGDARVGKTALITAAATEGFAERPPPTLPPTRLPADATPEGVPLVLTDTSSRDEDRAVTEAALRAADAVVVAFDVGERRMGGEGEANAMRARWCVPRRCGVYAQLCGAPRAQRAVHGRGRSAGDVRGAPRSPGEPTRHYRARLSVRPKKKTPNTHPPFPPLHIQPAPTPSTASPRTGCPNWPAWAWPPPACWWGAKPTPPRRTRRD